jgi:hypothetical protein
MQSLTMHYSFILLFNKRRLAKSLESACTPYVRGQLHLFCWRVRLLVTSVMGYT